MIELFGHITREPTLADQVARAILQTILGEKLQPGDPLPSERELATEYEVSRTVVREAIRALVVKGVLDSRTGRRPRVAPRDGRTVIESLRLYLEGNEEVGYRRVHEVREVLEVHIARCAAERATADDIALMEATCEQMERAVAGGDVDEASACDLQFHRSVASATNNELYRLLLDAISDALLAVRQQNLARGGGNEALASHRRILDAVVARDGREAAEAMQTHLDAVGGFWARGATQRDM